MREGPGGGPPGGAGAAGGAAAGGRAGEAPAGGGAGARPQGLWLEAWHDRVAGIQVRGGVARLKGGLLRSPAFACSPRSTPPTPPPTAPPTRKHAF